MIHLINCEHDEEGGVILLAALTDAQRACLMQIQRRIKDIASRLTEIGAGWPMDCVWYHLDLKGRYVYDHATGICRSALAPEKASNLATITSQYNGSNSIKNARRPVCWQAIRVLPDPPNKSSTFSPGRDE